MSDLSVPDHWQIEKIEDVVLNAKNGGTPSRSNESYWGGEIPWLSSGEVKGKETFQAEEKITEKGLNESSAKFFPENSVLVAMYGKTRGQSTILRQRMTGNQAICCLDLDTDKITPKFLLYYLKSRKDKLASEGRGGGQKNINQSVILRQKLPLPPIEEQREIVDIIEDSMKNIERLEVSVDELKKLTEEYEDSLLAFILSGKKDMSEGAVGGIPTEDVVPDDWRLEDFGDVVDVNPRISKPDTDTFAHVPMDGVSAETQSIDYFSERDSVYSGLAKFEEGDIVFARITPCMENGKVAIVDELPEGRDMSFGSTELAVFRTKDDVSTEYVFNYVKSQFIREVAEDRMKGATGRERVPLDFFKKDLKIPIPPEGQEDEVLEKLRHIRENVNKANHSIKMVDELFDEYRDSVLAHAFKGELVDIESDDRDSEDSNEEGSEGSRPEFDGDGQQSLEQIAGGNK